MWRQRNKTCGGNQNKTKTYGENWKLSILVHIMKKYYKHGFKDFIIALGYKKEIIFDYFKKTKFKEKWNIDLVNTGRNTLTAKRLLKLENKLIENDFFINLWRWFIKSKY